MTDLNDEISLLIPAYLRGELSADDAKRVEHMAQENPEIQADLDFQRQLRTTLQSGRSTQPADDLGWARLSKAMDADAAVTLPPVPNAANDVRPQRSKFWMGATAALALLAVGQFGIIAKSQSQDKDKAKYTLVSDSTAGTQAQIAPLAEMRVSDLSDALKSVDGQIVSGPSALGLYVIKFESKDACIKATTKLQNQIETAIVCH